MLKVTAIALGVVLPLVAIVAPAAAREQIPAETRDIPWYGEVVSCASESVTARIRYRFARTERRFWNSDAEIVALDQVREAAYRPNGLDLIPRRYCKAVAVMHDNRRLNLHYAIIEGTGFSGVGEGVQFCLEGYDRNQLAQPGCRRLDR